jgi:hypothetical protein
MEQAETQLNNLRWLNWADWEMFAQTAKFYEELYELLGKNK